MNKKELDIFNEAYTLGLNAATYMAQQVREGVAVGPKLNAILNEALKKYAGIAAKKREVLYKRLDGVSEGIDFLDAVASDDLDDYPQSPTIEELVLEEQNYERQRTDDRQEL